MMAMMAKRLIQGFMNLNAKGIRKGPASGGQRRQSGFHVGGFVKGNGLVE
jgi:hypothetical protein